MNRTKKLWLSSLGCLLAPVASYGQSYVISTVAGGGALSSSVNALQMPVSPSGLTFDSSGNIYFASNNTIFKLDQTGLVTRIAGSQQPGFSGDGGPATQAHLALNFASTSPFPLTGPQSPPTGLAFDAKGYLYVADFGNNRIRRISPGGTITTVAGNGTQGRSGDGGPACQAELNQPEALVFDKSGNLFIADTGNNRVRKVSPTGIISTFAGNGSFGTSGDGGSAASAPISLPMALAFDSSGTLFIGGEQGIRKVLPNGIISTATTQVEPPESMAMDSSDNVWIADAYGVIRLSPGGVASDVSIKATLGHYLTLAINSANNLFVADFGNNKLLAVAADGTVSTAAGNGNACCFAAPGAQATAAQLLPSAVALDGQGNLFIAESAARQVVKMSPAGVITPVAGTGLCCTPPVEGGLALNQSMGQPAGIAADAAGNLFIADFTYRVIRRVTPQGIMTTVAGGGNTKGDGGLATNALLGSLTSVAVDNSGNIFFLDGNVPNVREVTAGGIITTAAGNGTVGFSGDGGSPTAAQLNGPESLATDSSGNLYILDSGNNRVRKISPGGTITTVANSVSGNALAVDSRSDLFVAALYQEQISEYFPDGTSTIIAGNGAFGFSGDGGLATVAQLWYPSGLAVDSSGNLFVADSSNDVVRKLQLVSSPVIISAVLDAASESAVPLTPGKIAVIYGSGLSRSKLIVNQPANGAFGNQLAGTTISFDGTNAPIIYVSGSQMAAIVPYAVSGSATTRVTVVSQNGASAAYTAPVAPSAPSFFSQDSSGSGQIAAVNLDGSLNDALHPAPAGGYISLYATGEGQTSPAGIDGELAMTTPYPKPLSPVTVLIGGIPAICTYAGASPTLVAGLMQIVVQVPPGIQSSGYVPVKLSVGNASTRDDAFWIAVAGN